MTKVTYNKLPSTELLLHILLALNEIPNTKLNIISIKILMKFVLKLKNT